MKYDVMIIGGGPAGYTAAIEGSKNGLKIGLVECKEYGGTCLNRGCIPTKALLHSSELYESLHRMSDYGVDVDGYRYDLQKIFDHKNSVVETLRDQLITQMKKLKIDLIEGQGFIEDSHHVLVNDQIYECDKVIVSTGASTFIPKIEGIDIEGIITSDDILNSPLKPKHLIILGGGVIGCEIASVYLNLGCEVTIIEMLDNLLANMDKEIGRSIALSMKKKGAQIYTKSKVVKIEKNELYKVILEDGKEIEGDLVLVATGRKANLDLFKNELPLIEKGRIIVDNNFETNIKDLYAIGDVVYGYPQLAHCAEAMGVNVINAILNKEERIDLNVIVSAVYYNPEIASVGLSEEEAKNLGMDIIVGKANNYTNARSLINKTERGFVKIIANKEDNKIIGASMMADRSSDMIQEIALAIHKDMEIDDLASLIHGHPTYCEIIKEAINVLQTKKNN